MVESSGFEDSVKTVSTQLSGIESSLNALQEAVKRRQSEVTRLLEAFRTSDVNNENIQGFVEKPYTVIPRGEKEWFLVVPRFLNFQYGWLFQSDASYNIFIVNRYVQWLYPIPDALRKDLEFDKPAFDLKVRDGYLHTKPEQTEDVFTRYRDNLLRREGEGLLRIKQFEQFNLIANLIRDGILPFEPQPVAPEDFSGLLPSFQLRDYQKHAWEIFQRYGACGVYWPPGAGKMFFGLWLLAGLKGEKLVVVPTVTLVEEWRRKIKQYIPAHIQTAITVTTYVSADKYRQRKQPFALTVFDEHQHLPANTYSKLALLPTKYRVGLSATPFREDSRIDLIFALTGFPVGLDWAEYFRLGLIQKPVAYCYLVPNLYEKLKLLKTLVGESQGRALVFCDSLDLGKQIAQELNAPFVSGESRNRLQTISQSKTTVISRVGDEGIDIPDLQLIVEVSFLFGSRRQELQRFGRLLHSRFKGRHIIIMTKDEYSAYKKRLLALYEKGFEVKVVES